MRTRLLVALLSISLVAQSVTVPVMAAEPEVTLEEITDESVITTVVETLPETEEMPETEVTFEKVDNVADFDVPVSAEPVWESGEVKLFQEGEFDVTYEQVVDGKANSTMGTQTQSTLYEEWEAAYTYIYEQLKLNAASINLYSFRIPTDDIYAIFSGVINENPDLYYVTSYLRWSYYSGNGSSPDIVSSITPEYITGLDEELFNAGVEDAMSCIEAGMSDVEKAIAFHDYLAVNTRYDNANLKTNTLPSTAYSAYGILALRTGVCQGYALAYKMLCNKVGIECHMVTSEGMNHAWNLIKLDGQYYQVDTTWDDPVWDLLGRCKHTNMFVSDDEFNNNRGHYGWVVTSYGEVVDLQATSTKYDNYFWLDVNSNMIYDDHDYYYIDASARALKKIDMSDFSTQTLCSTGTWNSWGGGGYWGGAYSGLFENAGRLYFNKPDGIYSVDPSNTSDVVEEFTNPMSDQGYMYGCALLQGEAKYVISTTPNLESDLEVYTAQLKNGIVSSVSRVSLSDEEISVSVGETYTLTYSCSPSTATPTTVNWSSSDSTVATVTNGTVKALKKGTCNITLTVDGKSDTCKVTVEGPKFTVEFWDGEDLISTQKVEAGKNATPPTVTPDEGYLFTGWSGSYENIQVDTKLYAVYEPIEYTITYVVGEGSNAAGNKAFYTIETPTFVLLDATAPNGYEFVGWYTDGNYKTAISQITKGSHGELTLYAKYEPIVYSIMYELGEGSNHPDNISEYTIETNSFTLLEPTGAHGDLFAGWYTDEECTQTITEIKKGSTGNLTIYARWKLAAPTFSHTDSIVEAGKEISINTDRTNAAVYYTVDGSNPNEAGVLYDGAIIVNEAITIKAIAVLDGYVNSDVVQMSYEPVSVDFALDQQEISLQRKKTMQLSVSILPSGATEDDVIWISADESVATVDNGLVTAVSVGETTVTAIVQDYMGRNVTAECSVEVLPATYTVVFKDADGTMLDEQTVEEGNDAIPPEVTEPLGYAFTGWDGDYTYVTEDLILTAEYEAITYHIHYNGGDEVLYSNNKTEYTIESDTIVLEDPILADGYLFEGWYDNEECEGTPVYTIEAGSTGDVELYAKTVREAYSITYILNGGSSAGSNPVTYTVEDTIRLVPAEDNPGFVFVGWYEEEDFSDNPVSVIESGRTGDIVLYAKWRDERGLWMNDIEPRAYTGKKITIPNVKVFNGSDELQMGIDYTISYKNNTNANDLSGEDLSKAPAIVIKGKENYSGSLIKNFVITQKNIEEEDVAIDDISLIYKANKTQKPSPTVTWKGKKLKKNRDYVVTYVGEDEEGAFSEVGEYTIQIEGCGNYTGTREITLTIAETDKILMSKVKVVKIGNIPYTGDPVDVDNTLVVKYKKETLSLGIDYELEYEPCIEVGTHTIKVKGIGRFEGMVKTNFKITGVPMNKVTVTGVPKTVYYTGEEITMDSEQWEAEVVLSVTQMVDGEKTTIILEPDEDGDEDSDTGDYVVTYVNNIKKGKAQIIFTGKNGYTGTVKKTFSIEAYDIGADEEGIMSAEIAEMVCYEKGGAKPKPTVMANETLLKEGIDYTLSYKNNKSANLFTDDKTDAVVVVKGKGNYTGKMEVEFEIEKRDISEMTMFANDVEESTGAGKYKSKPQLTDSNGKKLVAGTDYEKVVEYRDAQGVLLGSKDKVSAGATIKVTAYGKGNYEGEVSTTYRVVAKNMSISKAKVTIVKGREWFYTGDKITIEKEDLIVKIGKNQLTPDDFEIVGYSNNVKKGTAKVTIKGKGAYGGTKTVSFKIKGQPMEWWTVDSVLEFIFG